MVIKVVYIYMVYVYGDQGFWQFNENFINNQDPHSQIENDEIPGENISIKVIQKKEK